VRGKRFLFLLGGEFNARVIDSQVVDSIVAVGELGVQGDLTVLMHDAAFFRRRKFNRCRRREIAARIPGRVSVYLSPRQGVKLGDAAASALLALDVLRHPRCANRDPCTQ